MTPMSRRFSGEPGPGPTITAAKWGRCGMSCWIVNWSFLIMWISQPGMDVLHKAAILGSHECLEAIVVSIGQRKLT